MHLSGSSRPVREPRTGVPVNHAVESTCYTVRARNDSGNAVASRPGGDSATSTLIRHRPPVSPSPVQAARRLASSRPSGSRSGSRRPRAVPRHQDGRFSVAVHERWVLGAELRRTIPPLLVSMLEDSPQGEFEAEQVASFGERVDRAVQAAGYPGDCQIAVTINTGADGNEIGILTRAGFYPVWR